jgi:hypothetical protein
MCDVDDTGGECPECGALITGSLLFDSPDGSYAEDDDELSIDDE